MVFVADSFYRAISFSTLTSDDTLTSDLALENLTSPQGIDFDPYAENIYWADNFRGEVQRSSIYGKNQTVIRSDLARPEALALDLVARNVYWINVGNMTIQVSDLNGKHSKVLVKGLLQDPSDLALDTMRGYVCFICFASSWQGYRKRESRLLRSRNKLLLPVRDEGPPQHRNSVPYSFRTVWALLRAAVVSTFYPV